MRIIEPYAVTPAMMTDSNVSETEDAPWDSGTTYSSGARVIFDHAIWESVQGSNTGHNPGADTASTWWFRIGATNRWRAFDERIGGLTSGGATTAFSDGTVWRRSDDNTVVS